MKPGSTAPRLRIPVLFILAIVALSCGRLSPRTAMTENEPPEIALDRPTSGTGGEPSVFTWRAHDPDGHVDHFV